MIKRLFLDIETLPPDITDWPQIAALKLGQDGPKDPEAREEAYRSLALSGEFGRLLCIGLIVEDKRTCFYKGVLGIDPDTGRFHLNEAHTLKQFWALARGLDLKGDLIVGHNILDFDLPFIIKRSIVHVIRPSLQIPFKRYQSRPVFDTMWEWSQ